MKKHLLVLASAFLVAPAALAVDGDKLEPVSKTPLLSGQAVASDAVVTLNEGGGYSGGSYSGGGNCGKYCDPCHRCFWIYGEYINWWTKGDDTPTLIRSSTTLNGVTATRTYGNDLNDNFRQGFRAGGGFYPHCKTKNLGIEANWFSLGDSNQDATFIPGPGTIVSRPFNNVITGQPDSALISGGPTVPIGNDQRAALTGQATVNHTSRFWGGNIGLRSRLGGGDCCGEGSVDLGCDGGSSCKSCLELQYGYQYYQLNEALNIRTSSALGAAASQFVAEDFDNSNQYHGGYLGFTGEYNCGKWFVGGNARGGVGYIQEVSRIRGSTSTTIGATTTTAPFGQVLALPSNVGGRVEDEITWSGEIGAKIGFQPTCWFRTYIGYDFIYIDQVFRPGGAVNDNVNRAQLAGFAGGPLLPSYSPRREAFWAHGLNVGFELKF